MLNIKCPDCKQPATHRVTIGQMTVHVCQEHKRRLCADFIVTKVEEIKEQYETINRRTETKNT